MNISDYEYVWMKDDGSITQFGGPDPDDGSVKIFSDELDQKQYDDENRFLEFYSERLIQLQETMDCILAESERRNKKIKARVNYFKNSYEFRARLIVEERVAHLEKKRFVRTEVGRLQLRKSSKIEVSNEESAIEWAAQYCPIAIKREYTLRKSLLPEDKEIPGVHFKKEDSFSLVRSKKKK